MRSKFCKFSAVFALGVIVLFRNSAKAIVRGLRFSARSNTNDRSTIPDPLFVMKTGAVLSLGDYSYRNGRITYTLADGGSSVIESHQVDWAATMASG